jgi:hypothetical protein
MGMAPGSVFYFNAIAGTVGMVEVIRELVKSGTIAPETASVENMIIESARYKFYTGESILPQGNYIRK